MAKLYGSILHALGPVTIYQLNGKTYIRSKSSLSRKQVLKSKAFAKTRQYANNMGRASQIGSEIYQALPPKIRKRALYQKITGEAASLLYNGEPEQEVMDQLMKKYKLK